MLKIAMNTNTNFTEWIMIQKPIKEVSLTDSSPSRLEVAIYLSQYKEPPGTMWEDKERPMPAEISDRIIQWATLLAPTPIQIF